MFGRTLKFAAILALTQFGSGCCWCCRPFFCHGCCGGGAPAACSSCYAPAGSVVAPLPAVSVSPQFNAPIIPQATTSANNAVSVPPYSAANYTQPNR